MTWIAIALGGALGALARYGVNQLTFSAALDRFPAATFTVNVSGCLLMGICYVLIVEKAVLSPEWRLWLMTGFLGAFTTFSAFALEAVTLWQNGHGLLALLYIALSVCACVAAVAVGIDCTQRLV